jgi:hypothetical protein
MGAFIGEAAGGYLADLFGARNVSSVTLLAALPLLSLGYKSPAYYTAGIILFNMTMPITLCAVATRLPRNPGFAFGLTTLLLLCGNLSTYFFILPAALLQPVIAILIAISAICLYISTVNQKGVSEHGKINIST